MGRIRARRDDLGWSRRELADRCADAGCPTLTENVLISMDFGRRDTVSVDELLAVATALDVHHEWLLFGGGPAAQRRKENRRGAHR